MNLPADPEAIAVYVHFPWCVKKCPYCDFNSHPLKGELDEKNYLQALCLDLEDQLEGMPGRLISSVFFGGGTPSLFSPDSFAKLLQRLEHRLAANAEITMEANPGTTEHQDLGGYRVAGVNRLSLGAQSFDNEMLRRLGRIHGAAEIASSISSARAGGFDNINLDLMYGLPGQSVAGALADLQTAADFAPEHISWYQLTLEPRTEFAARPPRLPPDDSLQQMEEQGLDGLRSAGYLRYEVSAFARDGRRCAHNLNYWTFGDYLGIGAGAHGKVTAGSAVTRTRKPRQPRLYLEDPLALICEPVAATALGGEFLLNALRLVEGVSEDLLRRRTGLETEALNPQWARRVAQGLLRSDRLATTPRGFEVLDTLVGDFIS